MRQNINGLYNRWVLPHLVVRVSRDRTLSSHVTKSNTLTSARNRAAFTAMFNTASARSLRTSILPSMETDPLPFPFIVRSHSGVRIALNSKLILESALQNRPHGVDNSPVLKSMQQQLRLLFIRKAQGDQAAENVLFEIHRMLYPKAHAISEPIERALDIRYLMCELSYLSAPVIANAATILEGPIELVESAENLNPKLYETAAKHWRQNATLQSVAVRIFLERLKDRKITTIDQKKLESDLAKLRKWDKKKSGGQSPEALKIIFKTNEYLPYQFHAQKWIKRKRAPSVSA